jgi:hypothetical protein
MGAAGLDSVPISSLDQNVPPNASQSITGAITLLWPFSSTTRKAAFLLADPDFRLRNKHGQVRVRVHGPAALAFAKSKIGIGDEITLHLEGGSWIDAEPGVSTPGKGLESDLFFGRRIAFEVLLHIALSRWNWLTVA